MLIVDGRNNHDWRITTDAIKATLQASGRFEVTVSTAPESKLPPAPRAPKSDDPDLIAVYQEAADAFSKATQPIKAASGEAFNAWRPDFAAHDVVVLNYNGQNWHEETRADFVEFVRSGGGVFLVHGANNAFRDWSEFNEIIGLGWRPAAIGKAIKIDADSGNPFWDKEAGNSAHGSKHPFQITVRQPNHPVMRGLPPIWMHAKDELYHHMRGPAKNLTILSSAWSDPEQRGTGQHEPITWEVAYGKGRTIVTSMGHCYKGEKFWDALHCVGFQAVMARSCEYLATGVVTIPIPEEFPDAKETSIQTPSAVTWKTLESNSSPQSEAISSARSKKKADPYSMLSPEEEATTFDIAPGYIAELVAAEPQVQEPVLTVWDANGAMYVAEMRSYMQNVAGEGTKTMKNGRVKRLEDTDGDGRMDKVTIFIDNLNLPRMILPLDDRILVRETDTMDVVSYRDTDHDGVADESEVIYKRGPYSRNSPEKSVEHQDSGLIWNIDNHIYLTYNMERYRFTDGEWKTETQRGHWTQWGLTHNDEGDLYWVHNSYPVAEPYLHPKYWDNVNRLAKVGFHGTPIDMGKPYDPQFGMVKSLCLLNDRGGSAPEVRAFTSACGQTIFRGHTLPWHNYGAHFVCDPTIHVVRRSFISKRGGLDYFQKAESGDSEFLRSSDINCRFVNTATGPDGCLYVTDMYRGIIQDAPWLSPGPREAIVEAGLDKNIQHGRIWRIRHADHSPAAGPQMLEESTVELLRHLGHDNGWWRDTAQKLIILRNDRETVVPLLNGMARFNQNALSRLHAVWTLEGIGALERDFVEEIYADRDPRLRRAAIQIAERWISDPATIEGLRVLAKERDEVVAQQLVLTLGMSDGEARPLAEEFIQTIARQHLSSRGMILATGVALWGSDDLPLVKDIMNGNKIDPATAASWKQALANWNRGLVYPEGMNDDHKRLIRDGEVRFYQSCVTCHGADGKGIEVPGTDSYLAPSLANSPRLAKDPATLIPVLLHGLAGPLDGKNYQAGFMAPAAALGLTRERDIATVLSYMSFVWGNGEPVTEDEVRKIKDQTRDRKTPWTQEELDSIGTQDRQ